jgi:hypothetical protein
MERFFEGVQRHSLSDLTTQDILSLYERDQMLWLRLDGAALNKCAEFNLAMLHALFREHPAFFSKRFSIENPGTFERATISAQTVYGDTAKLLNQGTFYCSSILKDNKENGMSAFLETVPFAEPPFLQCLSDPATHDAGVWLFIGHNASSHTPLEGRPEHTDKVPHSGTWHVQLSGYKTWFLRPREAAPEWQGHPPVLANKPGVETSANGLLRAEIPCERGDVLLVNTRVWWHHTQLPPSPSHSDPTTDSPLSISYARDFFLTGDIYSQPIADTHADRLEALAPLKQNLTHSEGLQQESSGTEEEDDESEDEMTNEDGLDPRFVAARFIPSGELALGESDGLAELVDRLPRALDPTCELCAAEIDGEEQLALLALRDIEVGEPLCIAPDEGEEYEEYELDTVTGHVALV